MEAIVVPKLKSDLQNRARRIVNCFLSKGFPYVKVELEANVRPRDYSSESECCDCYGSGMMHCGNCGGAGAIRARCVACSGNGTVISISNPQPHPCHYCNKGYRETTCEECSEGYVECDECHGRGYVEGDYWHGIAVPAV